MRIEEELAWLQRKPPDLQQGCDRLLFWGMQDNGHAAHDAQYAAHNAKYVQALLQDYVRQHSTADRLHPIRAIVTD